MFDWKFYINYHKELNLKTENEALLHWENFGKKEGRLGCNMHKTVDSINLLESTDLLQSFNLSQCIKPKIKIKKNNLTDDIYFRDILQFVDIYDTDIDKVTSDSKMEFRYFCYRYLDYMRNVTLPPILLNQKYEAVLIEFRMFPHLEFLIRNMISKLGCDWSHTVVCGNLNYDYIVDICKTISPNINVIRTDYDNLNQTSYSKFMASVEFWNMFHGEKILIYQEDSIIFKDNIKDFLKWDYIGAPWPKNQNDNMNCVGNGGFSLRTKQCMINVINTISIENTAFNNSTLQYMKNSKMTIGPEDVYFSLNMIRYNIGKVADWDSASLFSSESIYNKDSLGGHNFWLSNKEWRDNIPMKIIGTSTICAISSPYGLKIGGGEKNLLYFAKYFILKKKSMIYLFIDENMTTIYNTIKSILGEQYIFWFKFYQYDELSKFRNKVNYHFDMYNSKIPYNYSCSILKENSLFHCQFPFDTNEIIDKSNIALNTYNNIIVNSEYTKNKYELFTNKYLSDNHKIHIIYPCCFDEINNNIYDKDDNTFVMIGRIFDYNKSANNKRFDIALKYFEKLSLEGHNNFKIYIIGTLISERMLEKLKKFKITNIEFCINISDIMKDNILKKAKYIINMVGINRDPIEECYAYEHFGISIFEGINYGCIPMSINGGYPSYYITHDTGILFNNEEEFNIKLREIIIMNKKYTFNHEYYCKLLKQFTFEYFADSIDKIF